MIAEVKNYIKQIENNESLSEYLESECDFYLEDEAQLKDDLEALLVGGESNYNLVPFACDGGGGIYALLDNGCVGFIDSEGSAGIVGNSVKNFFSIILSCGYITDFGKFGALESKEAFLNYYNELEMPRDEASVNDFIRKNDLVTDPEQIYTIFKDSVMAEPRLTIKATSDEYVDSEQFFI